MQIEPNHVITAGRVWRLATAAHHAVLAVLDAANVAPEPFEHARFAEAAACEVLRKAGYQLTSPHAQEESSQAATRVGSPEKELLELHIEHEALLAERDGLVAKFNEVVKAHNEKNQALAEQVETTNVVCKELDKVKAENAQLTACHDAVLKLNEDYSTANGDLTAENAKLKDALAGGTARVGQRLEIAARDVVGVVDDNDGGLDLPDDVGVVVPLGVIRELEASLPPVVMETRQAIETGLADIGGQPAADCAKLATDAIDSAKAAGVGIDSAVTPEDGGPPQAPPVEVDKPDGEE